MIRFSLILLALTFTTTNINAQKSIFDAARSGNIKTAKRLVKLNPDTINTTNDQGYTPIILASYYGQADFIEFLIENKVKLNNAANTPTALQACCYKGFTSAVKLLLEYGADPNIADANGTTPLIYASQFNHLESVKLLLKHGANVYYKDPNGLTALDYAEKLEHSEIKKLLR